ncbi:ribosome biogenesis protein tsr1 [Boletus reticuloceps]|uniref:Ribosome biogenesis protein tsr1 n=1 Tax=Boletus reticuloceps TaxID=495285 RepID=A0A8I3AAR7_9AGAM|nr:ribosome biogenesis protein tsr1 [Boletus reticuloceps]
MVDAVHHHRPSGLKQQNKPFKSKHTTKSALKDLTKGRTQRPSPKSLAVNTAAQARLNRRNTQKQAQAAKRASLVTSTRIFNGVDGAPRIVAVIPLCEDVRTIDAVRALATSVKEDLDGINENSPIWTMKTQRFKTSLQFIPVRYGRHWEALDAAKAADYVLFLLSPTVEVTETGDTLLRTLQAQGLPTVVSAIPPDPSISSLDQKSHTAILKSLLSFMQYFDPSQGRVFDLSSPSDSLSALRSLSEGRPGEVRWRSGRTWLVGERAEWEDGTLKVTGIVRGSRLSANRLVHLPNFGDYQVTKIMSTPATRSKPHKITAMEIEPQVLSERIPSTADSIISTNIPDEMANEQTWPTEEEMAGAVTREVGMEDVEVPDAKKGTTPKRIKRIPKGMSEYQASWIVDETDDEEDDEEKEDAVTEEEEMVPFNEAMELESEKKSVVAFQDLDLEEEERQLQDWRNRAQEESDAKEFPDEIDTPRDLPARTRFARYRGLRSLRTSPNTLEYSSLKEFKRTERDVSRAAENEGVEPGTRVTVYLEGVPQEASDSNHAPIVLYGFLKHEHKKTVLHFTVQRNTEYSESIKSKDPLILCYGPRRLRVNPIYSQHTRGGARGANNVHKFERFLWHGTTVVASIYAPVAFGKQPCTLLRESENAHAPHLVAMGTFLNPDTTRIIAKRIVLSGHPFRVHRKTATVRYMFFNSDDVAYFKPMQLHTKHGRTDIFGSRLGRMGISKRISMGR